MEQDIQGEDKIEERTDSRPKLTQLKRSRVHWKLVQQKKAKVAKTFIDPISLTKGDLVDISETVRDVTKDTFE